VKVKEFKVKFIQVVIQCTNQFCNQKITVMGIETSVFCPYCSNIIYLENLIKTEDPNGDSKSSNFQDQIGSPPSYIFDQQINPNLQSNPNLNSEIFPSTSMEQSQSSSSDYIIPSDNYVPFNVQVKPEYNSEPQLSHFYENKRQDLSEPEKSPQPGYLINESGAKFELKLGYNIIGRSNVDINLFHQSVSRRHAVIEVVNVQNHFQYYISDIALQGEKESTNGVYLDHRSMKLSNSEKINLEYGMTLIIGIFRLTLNKT
jgi:hypothetical protein